MADRKRENSGAKNSRRNKADPGYGAQIREAERMLTEEQNGENPNNNKSADSTSEKNERSREDTAEQKLAKLAEERSLLIKQLENGLEEREKVVQELTEKLEKMPVGKDCDGTSNEYLSDEDAQKLLERVLEAENGAQKEKAEAEKRIEKARKAAERARKAKQQSDAVIKQAEKEVRDILDEADRKEKAIREEASLKQEHFNITDSKMQEIIDDINSRRPVQETESGTEAADTAVMSPKEKKAYIRAEKKALRERRRAERKKLAETKKLARNGYLPRKTQEQLIEDAIMEMIDENNLFGEARKSVKELVMCDGVDPNNNGYLVLNDSGQDIYVMCMYIEKNKRKNDFAVTYEKLMNTKGVTTSIYIEPMRDGKAVRTMDKRVLILDSEQQGAALVGGAAEAVAGRTSIYKYEAGNLLGNFRTGNSFAGSPQNMTDAQRNADISEICSELKDFSVNQAVTSPNAINSFTRRAEARLHDLAVEIESRYPGDGQKQQEEIEKQMEPVAREELRSCVIREALSGRHTMINRGYLEKSEVYQDIEDGIMEEYFRVQSLNNINGYLQNGDE